MNRTYFCSKCGGLVAPDARDCPHCKTILSGIGKGDEQERRRLRRAYRKRKWRNFFRVALRRAVIALIIASGCLIAYIAFTRVSLRWWRLSAIIVAIPIILLMLRILITGISNWSQNRDQRVPRERIFSSLRRGDLRRVTRVFEQRPEMCNVLDEQRNNALHIAAQSGHVEIVKFLLQRDGYGRYHRGGDGPYQVRLDQENCEGFTPLRVAERNGFSEIADMIRRKEAAQAERADEIRREEDARNQEEKTHAEMIAATKERTLKELALQGKRHYAICQNCGTAHEQPKFSPKEAGEFWYCKGCGSCLGRYDLYDGGTVCSHP